MPDSFNAYHEWLSLPAEMTAPTYYQILGLPEQESDTAKIAQAGDRALTRVRSFRPGGHAREWSRLLDEITSAKNCLLDAEIKAEYDRCLAKGKSPAASEGRRPPSDLAAERAAVKAPVNLDRLPPGMARGGVATATPATSTPAAAAAAAPLAEPMPAAVDSLLPPSVDHLLPAGAPQTMPASMQPAGYAPAAYGHAPYALGGMPVDPMAPLTAPGYAPAGYAAPTYPTAAPAEPLPASTIGPVGGSISSFAVLEARRARQARRNLVAAVIAGGLLIAAGAAVFANWQAILSQFEQPVAVKPVENDAPDTSGGNSEAKRVVEPGREPKPPPPDVVPVPETKPEPTPTPEPMPPAPMPETKPETKPEIAPSPMQETKPEPTPPTPPAPAPEPPPMPTKAELIALGKALAEGRAALANQNFEDADTHIAEAESLAKLPEHQALAARLKEVGGYVKQFRHAVDQALKGLQPADELMVGKSTRVIVVQVTPQRLKVKTGGSDVSYAINEIPPALTMALAESWLTTDNPVNQVIKGSYYSVAEGNEEAHRAKAKKYWDEAQSGGVNIQHLMPFLTDKYDLDKTP